MLFNVRHSIPGRIRLGYDIHAITPRQAALAQSLIEIQEGILKVTFNTETGSFLVFYDVEKQTEKSILSFFSVLDERYLNNEEMLEATVDPPKQISLLNQLASMVAGFYLRKLLPVPVRAVMRAMNLAPRLVSGAKCILNGKISDTRVLDAAAIGISLYSGDTATADNIAFLLNIGETIEDYTKKRSYQDLANAMFNDKDPVQLYISDNEEKTIPLAMLKKGDIVIVRDGAMIPCDGEVLKGEALVNQATITGEPLAVEKRAKSTVFAGTVVEEGEIYVQARSVAKDSKVNSILKQIEGNQELKVSSEIKSEILADKLVKYNFLLTGLTALITRNMTKVISTLMVDYSCAMKLIAPVAVLSAMKEAAEHGIAIKGGRYLEEVAKADCLVMDKTGTLTNAEPSLAHVICFGDKSEDELLRIAACLEEHYAHPIARALVKAANDKGLSHPEDHAKVEYIVAHGIASSINGARVLIGSSHFIFADEKVPIPTNLASEQKKALKKGESLLYLAMDGKLIGVFAINDPIRREAKRALNELKRSGMTSLNMIIGDDEGAARAIAKEAGIDNYIAKALPEDKVKLVMKLRADGHRVVMIGDGINDAPALSAANVGIAMGDSAAIAEDTADIVLSSSDGIESLAKTRKLGRRLVDRIDMENKEIVLFNSALIILGLVGLLPPSSSALLHNASTVFFSFQASRPLLG